MTGASTLWRITFDPSLIADPRLDNRDDRSDDDSTIMQNDEFHQIRLLRSTVIAFPHFYRFPLAETRHALFSSQAIQAWTAGYSPKQCSEIIPPRSSHRIPDR